MNAAPPIVPATPPPPTPRPSDLVRQIAVISAFVFDLIAVWVGVGGLGGTSVEEAQGGALAADATYLAPAGPAFSIWSIIYLGLAGYVVWQALPAQRASARHRAVGWWIALSIVLNGLWLVSVQLLPLWSTVVVIVLLLAVLCVAFQRAVASRMPDGGFIDVVLVDGTTGLHLGWVSLATVANIAAWLTAIGPTSWADAADTWGIGVIAVVALVGILVAWISGWRVAPGLALGWGLSWLAVARLEGQPHSEPIGYAALGAAVVVTVIPLLVAGLRALRPQGD